MKAYIKYILAAVLTLPMLSSCLDEETPTNGLTKDQLNTTSGTIAELSNAVAKQMISMGTSYNACGFAGQMIELDAMTGQIPVYSRERMLIELLRYKSKLPFDYYKEILLNYRKIMPQLDIQAIQDYAMDAPKSGKIMDTLQMEVL